MGMNLHDIVRGAININHPDKQFTIFRSLGEVNRNGLVQAVFAPAEIIIGNIQSEGDSALDHANFAGQNSIVRRLYVYAPDDWQKRPWALFRPLARTGDYIVDERGYWWLVVAVLEDFSQDGWESLRLQFQMVRPALVIPTDEEMEELIKKEVAKNGKSNS